MRSSLLVLIIKCTTTLIFIALSTAFIIYIHHQPVISDTSVNLITEGTFSPEDSSVFTPVSLPHDWIQSDQFSKGGWYRFNFSVNTTPRELYAVYFPTVFQNASVYLNGIEIGNGGSLSEPIARHWPRPLLFPIAPELIMTGKNELLILILSSPIGRGLLPQFFVGPRDTLLSAFWARFKLKVNTATSITMVQIIYGILLLLIPMRHPAETQYLWGAAVVLGFSGYTLPLIVTNVPVGLAFWEVWQHLCLGFTSLFINLFANRFITTPRPRQEKLLTALAVLSAVASIVMITVHETFYYKWGSPYWALLAFLTGGIASINFLNGVIKNPSPSNLAVMASGTLLMICATHDVLLVLGFISRENGYYIHYGSPIFAIVFSFILLIRFADSRKMTETLNSDLETRIAQKAKELEQTYQKLTELEKQQAASKEREQVTRDMHDGLGGYLASALAIAERNTENRHDLVKNLKDANEEIRLMLDIADSENDISLAVGSMRGKLERRLNSADIKLSWQVDDIEQLHPNQRNVIVNITRILQESISNILKHSKATKVQISLRQLPCRTLELRINDNGRCDSLKRKSGKGIKNIMARAERLKANLTFSENGELGGLSIRVLCPIDQPDDTAVTLIHYGENVRPNMMQDR